MQKRHTSPELYFQELAQTSKKFFLPYVEAFSSHTDKKSVLEIGCGKGGNLLPFAQNGYEVTGFDINAGSVEAAKECFASNGLNGSFYVEDVYNLKIEQKFDIVFCHDVIEHLPRKTECLESVSKLLKKDGIAFFSFPAWMMPFGGHQQICRNKLLCHWPWLHLLPADIYRFILKAFGENECCVKELLDIKRTRTTIEIFERNVEQAGLTILDRVLWLINPHYEVKFHLKPRRVPQLFAVIPWVRNFYTTSCFYILIPETLKQN